MTKSIFRVAALSLAGVFLLPLGAADSVSPYAKDEGGTEARYVRVFLGGEKRTLTLAEVEVFSNGKNIAPNGSASQINTASNGDAGRAIDGNRSPAYSDKGQTHTSQNTKNPWWEVDLGAESPIGSVSIWNRGDGDLGNRLDGFTLQLLDSKRRVLWEKETIGAPRSSFHIQTVSKGKTTYLGTSGKASTGADWKKSEKPTYQELGSRSPVEVPANHKDSKKFAFEKGDSFALIGNALGERFQHEGHLEATLQHRLPGLELTVRNMAVAGDKVGSFPRSKNFSPIDAYLQHVEADVIGCFFGYNESFDENPEEYTQQYVEFVQTLRSYQPNGESFPRIVLFSPIAHENLNNPNLPSGKQNNKRLATYTEAIRLAANRAGVLFVDLFNPSQELYASNKEALTINGIHLNELGQRLVSGIVADALAGNGTPKEGVVYESIREAVKDKNWSWFNRYRAVDGNDIWGSRAGLKFVNGQTNADVLQHELAMLDVMSANRDTVIWAAAQGKDFTVSDGNVPAAISVISNVGGGSQSSNASKEGSLDYTSGEGGISKMTLPAGYEVNLFADEAMFPEMVNPVQMQVDTKGRLWAAVWPTYPKWEPLQEMKDALVILEDTDGDGIADKCKEFARVHNPLGFEFWNGGVLVTSQPNLIFLKDTDGDDVADYREVVLNGFGSSDTHHTANNLIYGPDGHLYWQSGVFLQHNHEHPYGASLQAGNSAMYRWDPRRFTIALHANNSPNPHGIAFDGWGYHFANDGTGGRSYQVRPDGEGFKMHTLLTKEVRPVAADAIVSSSHFPDDIQQNFLVANTIGFLGLKNYKLHRDGYTRTEVQQSKDKKTGKTTKREVTLEHAVGEVWGTPEEPLLVSTDGNFRPTDAVFGEDGALYVSDWCNMIIGHMQHNIRDPNRDKLHGRIYRVSYPSRPLQEPVEIDGQAEAALMRNLEHPIDGVRHRTRVELSERDSKKVIAAAEEWVATLDPKNPNHARHLLEALWVHQQHNVRNRELLDTVLGSPVEHARIAAATVKHHWDVADPALGAQEIEEQKEMEVEAGGLISNEGGVSKWRVNTLVEQLRYDVKEMTAKAGQKMYIEFNNPDALPHNLVITKPGTATEVANAAIAMGAEGFVAQFIPESSDIIAHTDMIDGQTSTDLEFEVPNEAGDYEFVCTFPGHALIMRGILKVTK